MEQFRVDFLTKIGADFTTEQLQKLNNALIYLFTKYEIKEKKNEIVVQWDKNYRILNTYIATLRLEGKSDKTILKYSLTLKMFFEAVCKPLEKITTNDIRYYMADYQERRKISNSSLDNMRKDLSAFFSWATAEEYIQKNPMLKIKHIKQEYVEKKPFSVVDIEKMRELTNSNFRDRALIEFLYSTGCRISETVALNRNDIDYANRECVVFGKGAKERTVYISETAMYYIERYLNSRTDDCEALFLNMRNKRMSKETAEKLIRDLGIECGIKAHAHKFRRSCFSRLAQRGMPLTEIQKIAGHCDISCLSRFYVRHNDSDVKMDYQKAI